MFKKGDKVFWSFPSPQYGKKGIVHEDQTTELYVKVNWEGEGAINPASSNPSYVIPASQILKPRRPLDENDPDSYMESDRDFVMNNLEACVAFLEGELEC